MGTCGLRYMDVPQANCRRSVRPSAPTPRGWGSNHTPGVGATATERAVTLGCATLLNRASESLKVTRTSCCHGRFGNEFGGSICEFYAACESNGEASFRLVSHESNGVSTRSRNHSFFATASEISVLVRLKGEGAVRLVHRPVLSAARPVFDLPAWVECPSKLGGTSLLHGDPRGAKLIAQRVPNECWRANDDLSNDCVVA